VKATADHLHRHLRGVPPEGKTAGVVFVADDLAAWLIGVLADAGRKKLTRLVLGSDQERALQRAAAAAIEATAAELDPSGSDRARQLAMVVSEVFRDPAPDARVAGARDQYAALLPVFEQVLGPSTQKPWRPATTSPTGPSKRRIKHGRREVPPAHLPR
jgi:hypothetical protein